MSAIQFEFQLHSMTAIDPVAAGRWAAVINGGKEKNKKKTTKSQEFVCIFGKFGMHLHSKLQNMQRTNSSALIDFQSSIQAQVVWGNTTQPWVAMLVVHSSN